MQNFQDSFETRKRSLISAFSICMTVPLKFMTSSYCLNKNLRHMLLDILRRKKYMTWKLSQLIEYLLNKEHFMKKSCRKCAAKVGLRPLFNVRK